MMKKLLLLALVISTAVSCKKNTEKTTTETSSEKEISVLEKIANAHGFKNWSKIKKLNYTFNVDRDSSHFERSWQWQPQKEQVKMLSAKDTVAYVRKEIDSLQQKADQAFINDKYWLLFPFQLVWDQSFKHAVKENVKAPISKKPMKEITIAYDNEDGYTPGDTYKIYIDKDFIIREWSYIASGNKEPNLSTTWENYQTYNGLKIATNRQNKEESFKLYFTNIKVE